MGIETSVLIIGGSLNGLTTALCLGQQGVRCIVVERHMSTTVQYKFHGVSPRSMEIFRSIGVEAEILARDSGQQAYGIARTRNLSDPRIQWNELAWPDTSDISPSRAASCDQDLIEPILCTRAQRLGADVQFGTELVGFEQDAHEVRARVRNCKSGAEESIRADYLIAADGASSPVREILKVPSHGAGILQHWMNMIFETDLEPILGGRRFTSCFVTDVNGSILARDKTNRWLLAVQYSPERGERPEQFDQAFCRELVRKAAGRADVRADLIDARSWQVSANVADRFQVGRVFLVGDAAHLMPPTGGFAGNTGIQDGHNLAWKIAWVLQHNAKSELLHSYDSERRPIANATLAQALARLSAWFKDPSGRLPTPVETLPDSHVIFGQVYPTGAFLPETPSSNPFEDPANPSGRPGSRAPHILVECDGEKRSILDLFGQGFVLLCGEEGDAWVRAAEATPSETGNGIVVYRIGEDIKDVEGLWLQKYDVTLTGAVLVRPDGIIAWRAKKIDDAPIVTLKTALKQILCTRHQAPGANGKQ